MSSIRYRCKSCDFISKSSRRFDQCRNCLDIYCIECADKDEVLIRDHLKSTIENQEILINGKLYDKKSKFICMNCYIEQLN